MFWSGNLLPHLSLSLSLPIPVPDELPQNPKQPKRSNPAILVEAEIGYRKPPLARAPQSPPGGELVKFTRKGGLLKAKRERVRFFFGGNAEEEGVGAEGGGLAFSFSIKR